MLLMSCWYKVSSSECIADRQPIELSKRVAGFYTASLISGAFGGLLAGGIIDGLDGKAGTRGWKWLFIIEGLCTVVLATIAFFVLPGERSKPNELTPDYPATTKWLTTEEKRMCVLRINSGNALLEDEVEPSHKQAFLASVKDPRTWVRRRAELSLTSRASWCCTTCCLGESAVNNRAHTADPARFRTSFLP